jgi:hypothetical protein
MSCFASEETLQAKAADPTKHVNYVQGMVLGVDDFDQEFAYLSERGQWLARDLIGYGTASGLAVTIEDSDKGKRVAVSPGVAVSPRGQLIRVAPKQCALLNEWLKGAVRKDIPAGTTTLPVYVVLCYRDCPTDEVPILGEPCRTEEESMAPSRIVDDFRLELRLDPPPQREEDAVRDFVAWLRQIEIIDFAADPQDLKNFLDAIRAAAQELPSPIDFLYGSPPSTLFIPRSEVCEWLRAAFRLWVTELRPLWQCSVFARGCTSGTGQNEWCLLLAELDVPVLPPGVDWSIDPAREIAINTDRGPFLLHLRMIQEWLLCGRCGSEQLPGSPTQPATTVVSERSFNRSASIGTSVRYAREDHTHGTPPNPVVAHVALETAHNAHLVTGDVQGTLGATSVMALRGVNLGAPPASPANDGNVLIFRTGVWQAEAPSATVIEHTPQAGRYLIVAAGRFQVTDGARIGSTYNNLRVTPVPGVANEYTVTFGPVAGANTPDVVYVPPAPANAPRFTYMIKGTPVTPSGQPGATFNVVALTPTGIQIRVVGGSPQSFMIEISLFGDF